MLKSKSLTAVCLLVVGILLGASAQATVINVPGDYAGIQEAINYASNGDTVLVAPGTYSGPLTYNGKLITVLSSDGPLETIITADDSENLVTFTDGETADAVLHGFTLQGGWIGVLCENAAPTISYNILTHQNIYNWAAISLGGDGYATLGNSPAVIINNTIIYSTNGGISTFSTVAPVIKNNIIAFNNHYGIHREGRMTGVPFPELSYNDVYGNLVNYYEISDYGVGTISSNPLFTADFELSFYSPCIDAGDPDPIYYDPNGSRNDMGALPMTQEMPEPEVLHVPAEYPTIQEAIDAAEFGDTVLVAPGEYYGPLCFKGKLIKVVASGGPLATTITADDSENLVTFTDNESAGAVLHGFTLQGGWSGVLCENAGPTIAHNVFSGQNITNWAAISLGGDGYGTLGNSPAVIINNTIVNSANGGISTFSTAAPVIKNNIIAFNDHYGIHREGRMAGVPAPQLSYNDVYGNLVDYYEIWDYGVGTISLDPLLTLDFELNPSSPCIDAGDPDPIYNDPDNSRNDIGAVPYVLSAVGDIQGTVTVNGEGFNGVTVNLYDSSSFLGSTNTDTYGGYLFSDLPNGEYWVAIVVPLSYEAEEEIQIVQVAGQIVDVSFVLEPIEITSPPRTRGYWLHQTLAAISGNRKTGETYDDMCEYIELIRLHFNQHPANPVTIFDVDPQASCNERLRDLRRMLRLSGSSGLAADAAANFTATLLNVVSDKLAQWALVSADSATASQAISYCNELLTDDELENDALVLVITQLINRGRMVPSGYIDLSTPDISYRQNDGSIPEGFWLSQNYPNPFNPATEIEFNLAQAGHVQLTVYNLMGQKVKVLINGQKEAGYHRIHFDASGMASGVYLYQLKSGNLQQSKKMLLVK